MTDHKTCSWCNTPVMKQQRCCICKRLICGKHSEFVDDKRYCPLCVELSEYNSDEDEE